MNRVGLGTFPLAGVFNPIDVSDAERLVKKFISLGGYYIDTAPLYGNGEVERLLGRALKNINRDRYFLITKTVIHVDRTGKLFKSGKYNDVVEQIENSLLRLKVDHVDCLMVHSPDPEVPIDETLKALEKLQQDGKVRELAVSNVNLSELKEYNQTGKIRYIQNRFSLINRSLSPEFEKYLTENKIFLIPYHLLEIGLLTENALGKFNFRRGDLREQLPYLDSKNQQVISDWVKSSLLPVALELGLTIGQLNIEWALKQKYIKFVIVGTTKQRYLELNMKASGKVLSDNIITRMEYAYQNFEKMIQTKYGKTIREFRGLNEKYY